MRLGCKDRDLVVPVHLRPIAGTDWLDVLNGADGYEHGASKPRRKAPMQAERRLCASKIFNARSRQHFTTDRTRELTSHLGRAPSYTEMVLIARVVSNEWDLRRLDHRPR